MNGKKINYKDYKVLGLSSLRDLVGNAAEIIMDDSEQPYDVTIRYDSYSTDSYVSVHFYNEGNPADSFHVKVDDTEWIPRGLVAWAGDDYAQYEEDDELYYQLRRALLDCIIEKAAALGKDLNWF